MHIRNADKRDEQQCHRERGQSSDDRNVSSRSQIFSKMMGEARTSMPMTTSVVALVATAVADIAHTHVIAIKRLRIDGMLAGLRWCAKCGVCAEDCVGVPPNRELDICCATLPLHGSLPAALPRNPVIQQVPW